MNTYFLFSYFSFALKVVFNFEITKLNLSFSFSNLVFENNNNKYDIKDQTTCNINKNILNTNN